MRRNQTLSQRAQTSVIAPRSCVSSGSSQTAARGWRFGTKTKNENSAVNQIASRDQRKISGAGFRCARQPHFAAGRPLRQANALTGGHGAR